MAISREDAEEWTESLGQSTSGNWRQILLATKLGVPKALGLTTEQWVSTKLGGYFRMAVKDRREAVRELKTDGMSNRGIAAVLGVDHQTVNNDVSGENSPAKQRGDQEAFQANGENSPLDAVAALAANGARLAERIRRHDEFVEALRVVSDESEALEAWSAIERTAIHLNRLLLDSLPTIPCPKTIQAELLQARAALDDFILSRSEHRSCPSAPPSAESSTSRFTSSFVANDS